MISKAQTKMNGKELITEYLRARATLSSTTIKSYKSHLKKFRRFSMERDKLLVEVDQKDVAEYLSQYDFKKTKTTYKAILSAFYKWLLKHNYIASDPTDDITIKSGKKKKNEPLKERDYKKFLSQCQGMREYTIVSFFWYTGVRAKELRHVRLEDVDLNNKIIYITESKYEGRQIPIHSNFLPMLKKYYKKRLELPTSKPWLFLTKRGTQFSERTIIYLINSLQDGWNGNFTCHDFRRAFVTRLYKATNDLVLCQRLAGHSDISTTRGYILDDMEEHAKKFNAVDF